MADKLMHDGRNEGQEGDFVSDVEAVG